MSDTDHKKPENRIVGLNAASATCHDQISAVVFVASMVVVVVLSFMYAADSDVQLPSFLQGSDGATISEEVHLGATAAGLSFSGVLGLVTVWLILLYFSAWFLIIVGQLLMFLSLIGAGMASLHYAMNPYCPDVSTTQVIGGQSQTVTVAGACPDYSGVLWFSAILSFALAALLLLWLCCIRERIAFTAMILKSVAEVLIQLPELILIQFAAGALVLGYACLWALAYFELMSMVADESAGTQAVLSILAVFVFFWGELVIQNISLVTTAGAVGGWYFSGDASTSRGCFLCRPAVCTPLLRACTLQLGSIALGSLLVAIVRTVIVVVRYIAEQASQGNAALKIAFCCCICLLSCLERCIQWLTDFAFVYVAVYGYSFIYSGVQVVQLLGSSGIGAIAQTTLINPVISLACLLGAGLGGLLGYAADDVTGLGPTYLGVVVGVGVGYVLTAVGLAPVDAGAKTLFVCFAESPKELAEKSPALAAKLGEGAPLSPAKESYVAP